MSNPFKKISNNALGSKNTMYNSKVRDEASVKTRDCDTCGAPRPKNSNLVVCSYCKTTFMDIGINVKSDN